MVQVIKTVLASDYFCPIIKAGCQGPQCMMYSKMPNDVTYTTNDEPAPSGEGWFKVDSLPSEFYEGKIEHRWERDRGSEGFCCMGKVNYI